MKNLFIRLVALLGAAMAVHGVSAQEPQKHEAELRFAFRLPTPFMPFVGIKDQSLWQIRIQ